VIVCGSMILGGQAGKAGGARCGRCTSKDVDISKIEWSQH